MNSCPMQHFIHKLQKLSDDQQKKHSSNFSSQVELATGKMGGSTNFEINVTYRSPKNK